MNRDMEKKGIVLRELSCRTASELPAPKLPDYSPSTVEAIRPQSGSSGGVLRELNWCRSWWQLQWTSCSSAGAASLMELPPSFGASSAPGVHRRSCRTAAARLRRRPAARRQSGSSAPGVQSFSSPCRGSWTSESQCQSSFPPILLNHGRDIPNYESLLVEVPETSDKVFIIHNIIRGEHCFWP